MTKPHIWSVWQLMEIFDVWRLTKMLHSIECSRRDGIQHEIDDGHRDGQVPREFVTEWIDDIIADARELSTKGELEATDARVAEHGGFTLTLERGLTYQELDHELKVLRESVQFDLSGRFIYVIDKGRHPYLTKTHTLNLWGTPGFYFPSIRADIADSQRAYVFGLNMACVFHLMRITEVGLRALARRMRVKLPKNKQLEWGQWQEIIREMSGKVDKWALKSKTGRAKDEMLEFYRGSIGEFQGFKDAYRNFVMHMKEKIEYDGDEAHSLITRVSHFMNRLASNIDEKGYALTAARKRRIFAELDKQTKAAEKEEQSDERARQGVPELRPSNGKTDKSVTQSDSGQT